MGLYLEGYLDTLGLANIVWSISYDIGKDENNHVWQSCLSFMLNVRGSLKLRAPPSSNLTSSSSSAQKLWSPILLNFVLLFRVKSVLTLLLPSPSLLIPHFLKLLTRVTILFFSWAKYHYLFSDVVLLKVKSILCSAGEGLIFFFFCEISNTVFGNLDVSSSVSEGIVIFRRDLPFTFEILPCLLASKFSGTL